MRSSLAVQAAIAVLISSAAALQLPSLSSLLKRADIAPGTPLYNCHEACGEVILISEAGNYCSNSTYTTDLNSCLKCALTYNIWQYYGDSVKSAAESCSDNATPSSSSAVSGATATAATATTGTTSAATGAASTTSPTATPSGSASGSATSASATPDAASSIQQSGVLPVLIGAAAWALV